MYLIDGTRGWAEQVGLIRLTGDLEYVACSPDLVLHLDAGAGSFKTGSFKTGAHGVFESACLEADRLRSGREHRERDHRA